MSKSDDKKPGTAEGKPLNGHLQGAPLNGMPVSAPPPMEDEAVDREYEKRFREVVDDVAEFADIPLKLNVVIGHKKVSLRELLNLAQGSLLVLNRSAGESLLIYVEESFLAKGEVTVLEDTFAVRITEINDPRKL